MDIEKFVIENITQHWKKTALLVAVGIINFDNAEQQDIVNAIKKLVASGYLEVNGNIDNLRFSEVRLKK